MLISFVGLVGTIVESVGTIVGLVGTVFYVLEHVGKGFYYSFDLFLIMSLLRKLKKLISKADSERVGTSSTDEKSDFPVVETVESTEDLLKQWSKTIDMVEKHPLSQARVINTGVLNDLTRVLNSMNEKLDHLNKLDEIVSLLEATKSQLESAGLPTSNVDVVLSNLKGLTVKDQEALSYFKEGDSFTTEQFADEIGLSRSTASSRLNKLFSLGVLDKETKGKKIIYKLRE